jgi:ATPase family protein associated with various cellular activities (AAA)
VDTFLIEKATPEQAVRLYVGEHARWIEEQLECKLDDSVLLSVGFSVAQLAVTNVLDGVPLNEPASPLVQRLRTLVESVAFPPKSFPAIDVSQMRDPESLFLSPKSMWRAFWQDSPASIRFKGIAGAVVVAAVPVHQRETGNTVDCVIAKRECAVQFLQVVQEVCPRGNSPRLWMYKGAHEEIAQARWSDLVLSDSVVELVRRDFELFFQREAWFRDNHIPFRRGYLFHGPPGNGKTSVIRAMMATGCLEAFSIRLFDEETNDGAIEDLFRRASYRAPSMVVLEDIDRAFGSNLSPSKRSNVSLQQLLNSMDGLGTKDGIIVVATANDPTVLDPAILRRPGRFDRVVAFPSPGAELRARYFAKFNPHLLEEDLETMAKESEGLSFAQLREIYILAGQYAFERNDRISVSDLVNGIRALQEGMTLVSKPKRKVGFIESASTEVESRAPCFTAK